MPDICRLSYLFRYEIISTAVPSSWGSLFRKLLLIVRNHISQKFSGDKTDIILVSISIRICGFHIHIHIIKVSDCYTHIFITVSLICLHITLLETLMNSTVVPTKKYKPSHESLYIAHSTHISKL